MTAKSPTPNEPNDEKAPQRGEADEEAPVPRWVLPVIMIATLTIGGWFVIDNLWSTSKLEDCTMSGRKNCVAPIDTSNMGR